MSWAIVLCKTDIIAISFTTELKIKERKQFINSDNAKIKFSEILEGSESIDQSVLEEL